MSKVAMCRDCDNQPLVSTFAFYKKEFICLNCGALLEWMQPDAADETPELLARMNELAAEWREHAGQHLLVIGALHKDCEQCGNNGDYSHLEHATDKEKEASLKAEQWVNERTGKKLFSVEVTV